MSGRRVTVLGATGSVGAATIELILRDPASYDVEALTAHRNVAVLAQQARSVRARFAAVADPTCYAELRDALSGSGIEVAAGPEAVVAAAERPADWVMAAIVGAAGLRATLAAVRRGATVAFANKEVLVCAGDLVMRAVSDHGATLLPVDSEHNAIFQVLDPAQRTHVRRLILTASGGPFRTWDRDRMAQATPAQAVAHPVWSMGAKISVDSATMMNKGLEIIEAHYLFAMPEDRIDVVVHPQSVIHSLVEYDDGSILAQLGTPDMRTPIAYALGYPRRLTAPVERLDLTRVANLTFEPPDDARFPALRLARTALRTGGAAPTLLNAANEVAVAAFLEGRIPFLALERVISDVLADVSVAPPSTLDDIMAVDRLGRHKAQERVAAVAALA